MVTGLLFHGDVAGARRACRLPPIRRDFPFASLNFPVRTKKFPVRFHREFCTNYLQHRLFFRRTNGRRPLEFTKFPVLFPDRREFASRDRFDPSCIHSHAVGLCALCQVPALTAFALAARPARLPADEAAPDIDINSDEEKIVRVQAGTSTATPDRAAPPLRGREITICKNGQPPCCFR